MKLLFKYANVLPNQIRADYSFNIFPIPNYIDEYHTEAEFAVPYDDCSRAISDLLRVKDEHNIPLNHIIEVSNFIYMYTHNELLYIHAHAYILILLYSSSNVFCIKLLSL